PTISVYALSASSGCVLLLSIAIFFVMLRPPPRSTLFPYNDALPILGARPGFFGKRQNRSARRVEGLSVIHSIGGGPSGAEIPGGDRKSTRLNSSHVKISYAVFCLKKKKKTQTSNKAHQKQVTTVTSS